METPPSGLPAELSVTDTVTLLGLSRKRTADYTLAGMLSHRTVPSRPGIPFEWRVTTSQEDESA